MIGEHWKSFLGLLKAAKEGKLEPWQKPKPPGYRKRKGQRVPIIVVMFDNYSIDLDRKVLRLRYWNVNIPFKGKPRWLAKPGARRGRLTASQSSKYSRTILRKYALGTPAK